MIKKALGAVAGLALAGSLAVVALPSDAADHLDAPAVKKDGRTDITDVYAFQSMEHPENTVLIMDVNPFAGVMSGTSFDPKGTYEFLVDNDGDARADVTLSANFSNGRHQNVTVKRGKAAVGNAKVGQTFSLRGGGQAWAGLADDPFFFDLVAFNDQVKGAGGTRTFCDGDEADTFAGTNIDAIVLEVPSAWLTGSTSNIGVWARTMHGKTPADQMGRPAINTVFVSSSQKDTFNATAPADMPAAFGDSFADVLLALSGLDGTPYSQAEADGIAAFLLPDVLTIDTASAAGFPNGRQPVNDVIDAQLGIVTGGFFGGDAVLTSDCVGPNDVAVPSTFPYLADPH